MLCTSVKTTAQVHSLHSSNRLAYPCCLNRLSLPPAAATLAADGATIVAANKEARKPEKTIDHDVDSFMKNSCGANKWVIIELSQVGQGVGWVREIMQCLVYPILKKDYADTSNTLCKAIVNTTFMGGSMLPT